MAKPGLRVVDATRKVRIVSVGELLWDLFPDGPQLGGAAANVAYHATLLGADSSLISRVGDDELGKRALARLAESGVDVSLVGVDPRHPTGRVVVSFTAGEPVFRIEEKAAWDHIAFEARAVERLAQADAICFGTLAQRTKLMQTQLAQKLSLLTRQGSPWAVGGRRPKRPLLVLDLNLRPPHTDPQTILESLRLCDVVKLNSQELDWVRGASDCDDPIRWIFEHSPARLIALTRGAKGARLIGRQAGVEAQGVPIVLGDAVGAGDAFVAALTDSLCRSFSICRCLERANRHAAWVASQTGGMPSPS